MSFSVLSVLSVLNSFDKMKRDVRDDKYVALNDKLSKVGLGKPPEITPNRSGRGSSPCSMLQQSR
jgi:hypothetical protein